MISIQEDDTDNHNYHAKQDLLTKSKIGLCLFAFGFIITLSFALYILNMKPIDRNDDVVATINNIVMRHNPTELIYNLTWWNSDIAQQQYCLLTTLSFIDSRLFIDLFQIHIFHHTCDLVTNDIRPWEYYTFFVITCGVLCFYLMILGIFLYKYCNVKKELELIHQMECEENRQ